MKKINVTLEVEFHHMNCLLGNVAERTAATKCCKYTLAYHIQLQSYILSCILQCMQVNM